MCKVLLIRESCWVLFVIELCMRIYTPVMRVRLMSIIAAYNEAWKTGDKEALDALVHDDFVFNPHVGGMTMEKSDIMQFAGSGHTSSENDRILFENEEVGVAHSIVHFANDSDSEAVLSFMRFKDGQIISMETGATPLSENYKLVGQD
jgi:hypothetical protein